MQHNNTQNDQTHFGSQIIASDLKTAKVGEIFHAVAPHYDFMNDCLSLGLHRLWKRMAAARAAIAPNHCILDLACGTGDMARHFAPILNPEGRVILADINAAMLQQGRDRLLNEGIFNGLCFAQLNAEALPFSSHTFDRITMAFGLRNTTYPRKVLKELYRVLKKGGRAIILEFSKPTPGFFKKAYDAYSFQIIPKLGAWLCKDEASYRYLVESIRQHPDQETLKTWFLEAGFERCDYQNLSGGIVALHQGTKDC